MAAGAGANLALLGDKLPAEEAARIGLILQCVDDAALSEAAAALAARLADRPLRALVATRHALAAAYGMDLYSALANEAALQSTLGTAPDYLDGVDAFRQKRAPRFTER